MNVGRIVRCAINTTVAYQPVDIYYYLSQNVDDYGVVTPVYAEPYSTEANIQLANNQDLQFVNNINITKIYKRFIINIDVLSGLNRNLSNAGDYIVHNELKYKIVAVTNQFDTGFVIAIGEEGLVDE